MNKKIKIIIGLVLSLILITIGGKIYMDNKQKQAELEATYQPGFRLLEEQIATYIKENFSGVSKIEFSPIYVDGDNKFSMLTANVVPVIYDEYGNRALLGPTGKADVSRSYGLLAGLRIDYNYKGEQIITLMQYTIGEIEFSNSDNLPKTAHWTSDNGTDENITSLVKKGYLKDVKQSKTGSPKVEMRYNLEIRKGDIWSWH